MIRDNECVPGVVDGSVDDVTKVRAECLVVDNARMFAPDRGHVEPHHVKNVPR
jgi:hypothetical protein